MWEAGDIKLLHTAQTHLKQTNCCCFVSITVLSICCLIKCLSHQRLVSNGCLTKLLSYFITAPSNCCLVVKQLACQMTISWSGCLMILLCLQMAVFGQIVAFSNSCHVKLLLLSCQITVPVNFCLIQFTVFHLCNTGSKDSRCECCYQKKKSLYDCEDMRKHVNFV